MEYQLLNDFLNLIKLAFEVAQMAARHITFVVAVDDLIVGNHAAIDT